MIHKIARNRLVLNLAVAILVIAMPAKIRPPAIIRVPADSLQRFELEAISQSPTTTEIDEFIGPFASWANAKPAFGVVGDGIADDTAALQKGLDALSAGGEIKTLFLPSGLYRITRTLRLHNAIYINFIGEDPDKTIIYWDGPDKGVMFHIDGVAYSRYNRITWDGKNRAEVAIDQSKSDSQEFFDTGNEYAEDVFKDVGYGIRGGDLDIGAAETSVTRSRFIRNSKAGIITRNFNALDWWIWFSYFEDCGVGVTNDPGAGNFCVYNSVFKSSRIADISIKNTQFYSLRNNYSINSRTFYLSKGIGQNGALTVIQGNTILDTLDDAAIQIRDFGPVNIYDNVIRSRVKATGPAIVHSTYSEVDTLTIGNSFTVANPVRVSGRWITDDNKTVLRRVISPAEPVIPFKYLSKNRKVFDIPSHATDAVIKRVIDEASRLCGNRPIVHFPAGEYRLRKTLVIPANCDLQIVGDGGYSILSIDGPKDEPALKLLGPSKVTLRDLRIVGSRTGNGIVVENVNQQGGRIYIQEGIVGSASQNGLIVDGLDNANVYLRDFIHQLVDGVGLKVIGASNSASEANKGGRIYMIGGGSSNNRLSYEVTQGGRLSVKDVWYESGDLPGYMKLTGDSAVTVEQAKIYTRQNITTPAIDIQDYRGKATFIGLDIEDVLRISGASPGSVLLLGSMGRKPSYFFNNSEARTAVLLSRKVVPHFGTAAVNNEGNYNASFLNGMLLQTRSESLANEYEMNSPGITDVRMYRVYVDQTAIGIHIKR